MVSKTVELERLIWEGEDVRFDAAARGRLNRELHMQLEVRAESHGCYQAAWEMIRNMDWLERAGIEHKGSALLCPSKEQVTLILCGWGKNWQWREEKKRCKTFLHACFSICFFQHTVSS